MTIFILQNSPDKPIKIFLIFFNHCVFSILGCKNQLIQDLCVGTHLIEVNFREEKTMLGCGQAQVRNPESAERVPAFIAAIYAMLHLAAYQSLKKSNQN